MSVKRHDPQNFPTSLPLHTSAPKPSVLPAVWPRPRPWRSPGLQHWLLVGCRAHLPEHSAPPVPCTCSVPHPTSPFWKPRPAPPCKVAPSCTGVRSFAPRHTHPFSIRISPSPPSLLHPLPRTPQLRAPGPNTEPNHSRSPCPVSYLRESSSNLPPPQTRVPQGSLLHSARARGNLSTRHQPIPAHSGCTPVG